MLKVAWENGNKEIELIAFDRMGMCHYYLGDMERAAYYHDRMVRGKHESNTSDIRKIQLHELKKSSILRRGSTLQPIQS